MKILIIPDQHGSHNWEIAKSKIDEVDFVVFLGDCVDSWNNRHPDQEENLKNIFDFVRKNKDKCKYLLGNHDHSYISGGVYGSNCSGHQNDMISTYRAIFTSNLNLIDLAFECDGWVFSHAGFSKTAVGMMNRIMNNIYGKEEPFSIERLNKCWHERSHFHGDPNFDSFFDEKLDWDGIFSGSGDEKTQFCLWIRPHSLIEDAYYQKQIVGHTEYCFNGTYTVWKKDDNVIMMCDSRNHKVFEVFDTERGLPVEPTTEVEWQRSVKQLDKKLNSIKSLFGMIEHDTGKSVSEKDKRKKLTDEFGEKLGNEYFELFFIS